MTHHQPGDSDILAQLGAVATEVLGSGSEAVVYALGTDRVIRIARPGATPASAEARAQLLREIADRAGHLPFATPQVLDVLTIGDRVVTVEKRLAGVPVAKLLRTAAGPERRELVGNYLDAASRIGEIAIRRDLCGPLLDGQDLRKPDWNSFLSARLLQSAQTCPADLREAIMRCALESLPEPTETSLVHLDYFPANVLALGTAITAVLDFGSSSLIGDPRLDAWSAVAYLDAEISPEASNDDRRQAQDWLRSRGLGEHYAMARRWLAAYWSFAADDAALMSWCRRVLHGN